MTFFQQLALGPISLRAGGGDNWSQFDLAFTTNRNAGQAARETAIRFGFKSDHLLALAGTDNANDTYVTPEGKTVYGKVSITPGGAVHILTAHQVYAEQVHQANLKSGLQLADESVADLVLAAA
jgi:hypothetical protein